MGLDNDFIHKIISGDKKSESKFFNQYYTYIYYSCMKYVKNNVIAQDLSIDVFMKVLKSLPNFRNEHEESFGRWLNTIIHSVCLSYHTNKKRNVLINSTSIDDEDVTIVEPFYNDIHISEIDIIDKLPDSVNKRTFIQYALNGLTHKEIAKCNNSSISTVKVQYMRFKNDLKKIVNEEVY